MLAACKALRSSRALALFLLLARAWGETYKNPCHYDNVRKKTVCPGSAPSEESHRPLPTEHVREEKSLLQHVPAGGDFFKGADKGAGHAEASWGHVLTRSKEQDAAAEAAWTSSWAGGNDDGAGSGGASGGGGGFSELCAPFKAWVRDDYVPMSAGRLPVRCLLAQHQGLGDQLKGVMRCWAAALATQRPLVLDHSRSRSSWLWADASSILPGAMVSKRVFFNGSKEFGVAPATMESIHTYRDRHGATKVHDHGPAAARRRRSRSRRQLLSLNRSLSPAEDGKPGDDDDKGGASGTGGGVGTGGGAGPQWKAPAPGSGHKPAAGGAHRQPGTGGSGGGGKSEGQRARLEVEVGQSFARPEGLLPCDAAVGVRVGGIKPFLGLKPVLFNLGGSEREEGSKGGAGGGRCAVVVAAAGRLAASLASSRGDEAYCLLRALVRPSALQASSLERFLGAAILEAQKGSSGGSAGGRGSDGAAASSSSSSSSSRASLPPLSAPLVPWSTPVVGLHLRLQEQISTDHDVNWALYCAESIALQLASRGNGNRGSPAVLFVLATDTPALLGKVADELRGSPVCRAAARCGFATNEGVGTMGHISNKATAGKTSVSQRTWADWFLLSEASLCVYSRSGFPRMACQASHHRAALRGRLFEKSSCGVEGRQSWRNAETDVEPLDSGCESESQALAAAQCLLTEAELKRWS